MNNIRFLRTQAGLTLKELGEISGVSYSLISKFEREEEEDGRALTKNCAEKLAVALAVTPQFLEGAEDHGILCSYSDNQPPLFLSKAEYIREKRYGRVSEEIKKGYPIEGLALEIVKRLSPNGWADPKEMAERPHVKRTIFLPLDVQQSKAGLKAEIEDALSRMNEQQLEKTLLIIKEVILK